jgi:ribosomal protein S18 acetylase RimI-like enzyme
MSEALDNIVLRSVSVADLRTILGELEEFWDERDTGFLHQALYVHEFGETSVLVERDGEILGYLLGFVSPDGAGYIHAVAVRRSARGRGFARRMYERFCELVGARGADRLKAITSPENDGSRSFHEALGFSVARAEDYSPSGGARLVFRRELTRG